MSNNNETPVIPKKRGRKPKQVILSQNEPITQTTDTENKDNAVIENINVIIEESNNKLTEEL